MFHYNVEKRVRRFRRIFNEDSSQNQGECTKTRPGIQRGANHGEPCSLNIKSTITMDLIWMLIIGLIVGAVAKLLMPGKDPGGFLITMVIGVVGAMLAGFLGRSLGWYNEGEPVGFIASVVGAIILLLLYRVIRGRSVRN